MEVRAVTPARWEAAAPRARWIVGEWPVGPVRSLGCGRPPRQDGRRGNPGGAAGLSGEAASALFAAEIERGVPIVVSTSVDTSAGPR